MSRALFALDLANDPDLIAAYEARHAPGSVWPEVVRDIRQRGYREMEIWRVGNRLVMLAEISPDGLSASDPEVRPVVDRWEAEMDVYQRPIVADGPKWQPMTRIFSLEEQPES